MTSILIPPIWADHYFKRKSKLGMESRLGPVSWILAVWEALNCNLWEIENQKSGSGSAGEKDVEFISGQFSRCCTTVNLHMLQHDISTFLHSSE
jgi:hypothetical protein